MTVQNFTYTLKKKIDYEMFIIISVDSSLL